MAITYVQGRGTNGAGNGTGIVSLPFTSANTAGNLLLVFWALRLSGGISGSVVTCTDTNLNSYVLDLNASATNTIGSGGFVPMQYGVFSCRSCATGTNTVTLKSSIASSGGFNTISFLVLGEVSGNSAPNVWTLDPNCPLTLQGTGTPAVTPTLNTTFANELVIGWLLDSETPSVVAPWGAFGFSDYATGSTECYSGLYIPTTTGSYSGSFTTGSGDVYASAILGYGSAPVSGFGGVMGVYH